MAQVSRKRKVRKNIPYGIAHIHATFNNTIVSITDPDGNAVSWSSAGAVGYKGSKKSTPFAAGLAAEAAAKSAMENDETREAVRLLTKNKTLTRASEKGLAAYYEEISKNRIASIVKLLDRCNNISGMATAFTEKRMAQYIQETEKYIYPMMENTSNQFPEYANQIFLIKYHMTSVIEAIRHDMARNLK